MTLPLDIYRARRQQVFQRMRQQSPNSLAYLHTAPEVIRNRDSDYAYRHDSYFYYLTGFDEPQSSLVLIAGETPEQDLAILFCRPKNLEREIWDGYRYGPEAARTTFGMDQSHSISDLDQHLPQLLANRRAIFTRLAQNEQIDAQFRQWLAQVRQQARLGVQTPATLHDLEPLLDEMRLIKDAHEIEIMRQAAQISAKAHRRAMQVCQPGLREYHLEAELLHEFRTHGAQSVAYNSIVAAGANACVLHYRAGNTELKAGDLCLIDAGCELDGYASDITRTFPINGRFNTAQRALYDLVLAAQEAAIRVTRPGQHFLAAHQAAVRVLAQGMLDLKLLDPNQYGSLEDVLETKAYSKFYMHRTGHWIGMDVHDCGSYLEPNIKGSGTHENELPWRILQVGMATTIEPGIYIRPDTQVPECYWHIGIRIEDDALITPTGCELISRDVPVTAHEIEALMKQS